jgi:hypothetical protein
LENRTIGQVEHGPLAALVAGGQVQHVSVGASGGCKNRLIGHEQPRLFAGREDFLEDADLKLSSLCGTAGE